MTPVHISYQPGVLRLLDQTQLPAATTFLELRTSPEVAAAIKRLCVRGAPAIGIAAAYAMAIEAHDQARRDLDDGEFLRRLEQAAAQLVAVRPTAVNLAWAVDQQLKSARARVASGSSHASIAQALDEAAETIHQEDIAACRRIGDNGAAFLLSLAGPFERESPSNAARTNKLRILTHCNTGDLATGGYGTALGVIRSAWKSGNLERVLVDETRPLLQGARLTVWELQQDGIPYKLITDSMGPHFMQLKEIDAVVVGADRIARNGDTANKIGTYGLALAAKAHGLPFIVAAPVSTFDTATASGADIVIEERNPQEVTSFAGAASAPIDTIVANPAFDITPAAYVTAIATERGMLAPPFARAIDALFSSVPATAKARP